MNNKLTRNVLLPALLLFVFVFSTSAATEEQVNRQLNVQPGGKLIVDVDFGGVDVCAGASDKVTIDAFRSVDFGDEAKEKEYLASAPVTISADGNVVTVRARSAVELRHHHWQHSTMDGRYTLHVPRNFAAELKTGGGSIAARELSGELRADSGGGKVKCAHLQGARTANTGGGSIDLENCEGASDAETGGGDILATAGQGTLSVRTGGGAVEVRDFNGDTDVETGGGEIKLERIRGRIAGETGGGSITASIPENVANEINLESSGGSIELALPATAAMDIDAATSSGRIKSSLPLETTRADEGHLRGKLNGGGKRVLLRTAAGSITIKSASSETVAR
jgi:DUF4097 and DUF4098 domain-containing protein YvlB